MVIMLAIFGGQMFGMGTGLQYEDYLVMLTSNPNSSESAPAGSSNPGRSQPLN